jgi:hypothetical protein
MRPLISKHHKNWMSNLKGGKIFPLFYAGFPGHFFSKCYGKLREIN